MSLAIDYVVAKVPRFAFEKFLGSDTTLTSSMKSVGEVMSIGRSFKECLQKALRSLEIGARGLGGGGKFGGAEITDTAAIANGLVRPTAERIFYMRYALLAGMSREQISEYTKIDLWFVNEVAGIVEIEKELSERGLLNLDSELLEKAKKPDSPICKLLQSAIQKLET